MNRQELTGRARTHVVPVAASTSTLHVHAVAAFEGLQRAAALEGFELQAVSDFRDFDRQLAIWNGKFSGTRPLLDALGRPLDASQLSPAERVVEILRWSALPGASRHHWGTDVDLMDVRAVPPGYRVGLTAEEFAPSGPFGPLLAWLDTAAARFGFFRPYRGIRSGVAAEPWHFSFAPVAESARRALDVGVLEEALSSAALQGKREILARLGELHERYVRTIDGP